MFKKILVAGGIVAASIIPAFGTARAEPSSCWGLQDRRDNPDTGAVYCDQGSGWGYAQALCRKPWSLPADSTSYAVYSGPQYYKYPWEAEQRFPVSCTAFRPNMTDLWVITW